MTRTVGRVNVWGATNLMLGTIALPSSVDTPPLPPLDGGGAAAGSEVRRVSHRPGIDRDPFGGQKLGEGAPFPVEGRRTVFEYALKKPSMPDGGSVAGVAAPGGVSAGVASWNWWVSRFHLYLENWDADRLQVIRHRHFHRRRDRSLRRSKRRLVE